MHDKGAYFEADIHRWKIKKLRMVAQIEVCFLCRYIFCHQFSYGFFSAENYRKTLEKTDTHHFISFGSIHGSSRNYRKCGQSMEWNFGQQNIYISVVKFHNVHGNVSWEEYKRSHEILGSVLCGIICAGRHDERSLLL